VDLSLDGEIGVLIDEEGGDRRVKGQFKRDLSSSGYFVNLLDQSFDIRFDFVVVLLEL